MTLQEKISRYYEMKEQEIILSYKLKAQKEDVTKIKDSIMSDMKQQGVERLTNNDGYRVVRAKKKSVSVLSVPEALRSLQKYEVDTMGYMSPDRTKIGQLAKLMQEKGKPIDGVELGETEYLTFKVMNV